MVRAGGALVLLPPKNSLCIYLIEFKQEIYTPFNGSRRLVVRVL